MRLKYFTFCVAIFIIVFVYSLIITPFATGGDQRHYIKIYEAMSALDVFEAYSYYLANLDSKGVFHFLFSWMFSALSIDKVVFVSVFNAVLALFAARLLIHLGGHYFIVFLIVVTSFYFNVLYFSAERLKFGVLFFLLSIYHLENKKVFYLFSFISVMSHAQMLISYFSVAFYWFMKSFERMLLTGRLSKSLFLIMVFGGLIAALVGPHVMHKANAYLGEIKPIGLVKVFVIFVLTLYYSNSRKQVVYLFIPVFVVVLFIGSDRVFMLGYFIFLYFALGVNRGINVGVISTTLYFSLKSIPYLYNLIVHANGFYR